VALCLGVVAALLVPRRSGDRAVDVAIRETFLDARISELKLLLLDATSDKGTLVDLREQVERSRAARRS